VLDWQNVDLAEHNLLVNRDDGDADVPPSDTKEKNDMHVTAPALKPGSRRLLPYQPSATGGVPDFWPLEYEVADDIKQRLFGIDWYRVRKRTSNRSSTTKETPSF
jgi:hypothetical protein